MVPTSWLTVLGFFAFVAPGVFYDLMRATRLADRRETAFREIGRIVLVSTWCAAVALAIGVLVAWVVRSSSSGRDFLPGAREIILSDKNHLADHVRGVVALCVGFVLCSLFVAWVTFAVVYRHETGKVTRVSTWKKAFGAGADLPKGAYPLVRVRLLSGSTWTGRVAHFSTDLELADRELVLSPPLALKVDGVKKQIKGTGRVILRSDQIESIAVRYMRIRPEPDAPGG